MTYAEAIAVIREHTERFAVVTEGMTTDQLITAITEGMATDPEGTLAKYTPDRDRYWQAMAVLQGGRQ
jgi:hypothetical protein